MPINLTLARAAAVAVAVSVSATNLAAQTVVKLPKNRYTPQQDVELGREAAAEVRKQYPIIEDERIARYLDRLGDRLVAAAPPELKQPVYEYSFTPVNLKEINAFALPGGPMFVHRGMFDAAAAEGEVVGVMAHELSHVLLRHGTANASKAQNPWLQLGQIAGVVGGAVVGGAAGSAIAQGSQFGLGTLLLRYSRDFEKQADLLGAQIMARAGYDPRALARMFETIERESKSSGGSGPQWMSSHPNPGQPDAVHHQGSGAADDRERGRRPASSSRSRPRSRRCRRPSRWAIWRGGKGDAGGAARLNRSARRTARAATSAQYQRHQRRQGLSSVGADQLDQLWRRTARSRSCRRTATVSSTDRPSSATASSSASRRPDRAICRTRPTPGSRPSRRTIQSSALAGTQQAIANLAALGNRARRSSIRSPLGGRERIGVYTTFLADGSLFYYLTIVPEKDAAAFQEAFQRVGESIRLTEAR